MNVAIIHYHRRHGGVTDVIRGTSELLCKAGVNHVVLTGDADGLPSHGMPVSQVEGLSYGDGNESASGLIEQLQESAFKALGGRPDVWHFHNHSLGKNDSMHEVVARMASDDERLLLHIHDLAEDGRPENARSLAGCRSLYPDGPRIHYAFLNSRDRGIFLDAGLPASRAHLLCNSVSAYPPDTTDRTTAPLILYPVRGIRRKNLGELLMLVALAPAGTRCAVTLAPRNPAALEVHDAWWRFAKESGICIEFDAVDGLEHVADSASSFESWCERATHFVTTSVSEGFGMTFLESIARGKPLLGRKLPHLASDHASHGISFPWLYDRLLIPSTWVDAGILETCLVDATTLLWGAWGSDAPPSQCFRERLEHGAYLDFANLPEILQQRAIQKLSDPDMKQLPVVEAFGKTAPAAMWLAEALAERRPASTNADLAPYAPESYLEKLLAVYETIRNESSGETRFIDPCKILNRCLTAERFHFLTSPRHVPRPEPDWRSFRAIIFDVYGTLLSAASCGVRPDACADPALREIITRFGYPPPDAPSSELYKTIRRHHLASGLKFPEVDLRAIWREVLGLSEKADTTSLVVETEAVWHPARLIDGVVDSLQSMASHGIHLGLLSNAQCNTLRSLDALAGIFSNDLLILSYEHGVAKPAPFLFELLATRLAARGITPGETLYVGNDPLHDIEPANAFGFQTALFTGHPDSIRAGACWPDFEIRSWSGLTH